MTKQISLSRKQMQALVDAAKRCGSSGEGSLYVAKDQGAYVGAGHGEKGQVYYFRGCDPSKDECWHEECSYAFGGDDFGELLDIAYVEKLLARFDIEKMQIRVTPGSIFMDGIMYREFAKTHEIAVKALNELYREVGQEKFNDACIANAEEQNDNVCHSHDCADMNVIIYETIERTLNKSVLVKCREGGRFEQLQNVVAAKVKEVMIRAAGRIQEAAS